MTAVVVVAHHARLEQATALAETLDAEMFVDDGSLGEWDNHERAIRWAAEHGTHAVVVQDDALPIPEFRQCVEQAIEHRPDDMIGLYVGRLRPERERVEKAVAQADEVGASWLTHERLLWGVATIMPNEAVPALLEYRSHRAYDLRLGRAWAAHTRRPVLYTWPSLVDHADQPSVITGRPAREDGRVAHRVGVPTWSDVSVAIA
jgi:hypothetical protein